jgi:hypothetical protein
VQQRAERADHERYPLLDGRLAEVADAEVEERLDAPLPGELPGDLEHLLRLVDPDHPCPGLGDRHGDTPGADRELHDGAARVERLRHVEGDVLGHRPTPRVVDACDRVVQRHGVSVGVA